MISNEKKIPKINENEKHGEGEGGEGQKLDWDWEKKNQILKFIVVFIQSLSHVWLCNPINCCTPGSPVLHYVPEFAQTMSTESVVLCSHLMFCCPLLFSPSKTHQGFFQRVNSSHQVAKVLELQRQHQSFQ